jgi:hypothetical protein
VAGRLSMVADKSVNPDCRLQAISAGERVKSRGRGCLRHTQIQREKANHVPMTGLYFMPATTYSPTHFRVQYHRPCGA